MCLNRVSAPVLLMALEQTRQKAQNSRKQKQASLAAFLTFLRLWLERITGRTLPSGDDGDVNAQDEPNRAQRQMQDYFTRHSLPVGRDLTELHYLFLCQQIRLKTGDRLDVRRELVTASGKWTEFMSLHSPLGRVFIYCMIFWGSVAQRRALLVCYDHGWWRAPLGAMGRLRSGVWAAHLWPG